MNQQVNIVWNVNVNDLVYAPDPRTNKEVIGLVVKQNNSMTASYYKKSNISNTGSVLVMTGSGKYWYLPSKLRKIDEA